MQKNLGIVAIIFTLCISGYSLLKGTEAPKDFPKGKTFFVNEGESLLSISKRLEEEGFIHSPLLFRMWISFLEKDKHIKLGGYIFNEPQTLFGVAHSFVEGRPARPLLSVTVPEGSTTLEILSGITKILPNIDRERFMEQVLANSLEGKLFPSTYFVLPSYKEEDVISLMAKTFTKKVEPIVEESNLPKPLTTLDEVVVLASILEGEANTEKDMKIVAGILLFRMNIGMPLQVDVAMETYKTKGLPKEPINNPGLTAIKAVLNPIQIDYLYYITGNDGSMYYSKTYTEHKRNIQKYLK